VQKTATQAHYVAKVNTLPRTATRALLEAGHSKDTSGKVSVDRAVPAKKFKRDRRDNRDLAHYLVR